MIELTYVGLFLGALNLILIIVALSKLKDISERIRFLRSELFHLGMSFMKREKEEKPKCKKCGKPIEEHTIKEAVKCGLVGEIREE